MNDYLNSNLESLVKKVYDEGVEKGNENAQLIISSANQHSDELLKKAELQIAKMKEQTLNEVKRLHENVRKELKSAMQQTVSAIKNELSVIIINKITLPEISPALQEKEFFQKMIFTILQKWDPVNTNFKFELHLNENDEAQLRDLFDLRIKKDLTNGIEIVIDNKIKSGFKIGVKDENYYVSFTDVDFEQFFKGYIHKKTLDWVYGKKQN